MNEEIPRRLSLNDAPAPSPALIVGAKVNLNPEGKFGEAEWKALAERLSMYSDKRYETARYFFVKDGTIVRQVAVSSQTPSSTLAFPDEGYHWKLREWALDNKAKIVFCHNHPSGYTAPSEADEKLTSRLSNFFNGDGEEVFLGHVILDHGSFGLYTPESGWKHFGPRGLEEFGKDEGGFFIRNWTPDSSRKVFPVVNEMGLLLLAKKAREIDALDSWNSKDWVPAILASKGGEIRSMEYANVAEFKAPDLLLSRMKEAGRLHGAGDLYLFPTNWDQAMLCRSFAAETNAVRGVCRLDATVTLDATFYENAELFGAPKKSEIIVEDTEKMPEAKARLEKMKENERMEKKDLTSGQIVIVRRPHQRPCDVTMFDSMKEAIDAYSDSYTYIEWKNLDEYIAASGLDKEDEDGAAEIERLKNDIQSAGISDNEPFVEFEIPGKETEFHKASEFSEEKALREAIGDDMNGAELFTSEPNETYKEFAARIASFYAKGIHNAPSVAKIASAVLPSDGIEEAVEEIKKSVKGERNRPSPSFEELRSANQNRDKLNFVLDKLSKAGIEIVTDKAEFDRILEQEKLVQKMAIDISEFEKTEKEIQQLRNSISNISKDNKNLVREQEFVDFQTSLIACKKYIENLPGQKLPVMPFEAKNDKGESISFNFIVQLKNDELVLTTSDSANDAIYNFETKVTENNFKLEKFKDMTASTDCCEILVNTVNKHLGEELGKQRSILKKLMQENAILSGKSLDELSAEEIKELKEKLKEQEYENIEGIYVHKDKKVAVTPDVYVSEIQNAKLLVDNNYTVYLLPENFAFKRVNELEQNESYSTPDTLTSNEFVELKTTKKKVSERFGDAVAQSNNVLIRIKDDISLHNARKRIQNKIKNLPKEKGFNVKDGNIFLYFEKTARFISAEIKNGKIQILPTLPKLADFSVVPPANISIPQNNNLSSAENINVPENFSVEDAKKLYAYLAPLAQSDETSVWKQCNIPAKSLGKNVTINHIGNVKGEYREANIGLSVHTSYGDNHATGSIVGETIVAYLHEDGIFKSSRRSAMLENDADQQSLRNLAFKAYASAYGISERELYESVLNHDLKEKNNKVQTLIQNNSVYGFAHGGKIYLNPDVMTSEAAVHEYTHLWDAYTQKTNPELWRSGMNIFKGTSVWNEVLADPNYEDIAGDDDLILSEVHARICGKMADAVLEKISERDGELKKVAAIDWDKEVTEFVAKEFGGAPELGQEDYVSETVRAELLKEFLSSPMKDLMSGLQITKGRETSGQAKEETVETEEDKLMAKKKEKAPARRKAKKPEETATAPEAKAEAAPGREGFKDEEASAEELYADFVEKMRDGWASMKEKEEQGEEPEYASFAALFEGVGKSYSKADRVAISKKVAELAGTESPAQASEWLEKEISSEPVRESGEEAPAEGLEEPAPAVQEGAAPVPEQEDEPGVDALKKLLLEERLRNDALNAKVSSLESVIKGLQSQLAQLNAKLGATQGREEPSSVQENSAAADSGYAASSQGQASQASAPKNGEFSTQTMYKPGVVVPKFGVKIGEDDFDIKEGCRFKELLKNKDNPSLNEVVLERETEDGTIEKVKIPEREYLRIASVHEKFESERSQHAADSYEWDYFHKKYGEEMGIDRNRTRMNTAANFLHNFKVWCRASAENPQAAMKIARDLVGNMSEWERARFNAMRNQWPAGPEDYDMMLVHVFEENSKLKGTAITADRRKCGIGEASMIYELNKDDIELKRGETIPGTHKRVGETVKLSMLFEPLGFKTFSDKTLAKYGVNDRHLKATPEITFEIIGCTKNLGDRNEIILASREHNTKYVLPLDPIVEKIVQQEKELKSSLKKESKAARKNAVRNSAADPDRRFENMARSEFIDEGLRRAYSGRGW